MKKTLLYICMSALAFVCCDGPELPDHTTPVTIDDIGGTLVPIKQFKDYYMGYPTVVPYDWVIEGQVTSTDITGNFYRSFYIQDASGAIEVREGTASGLYLKYKIGQQILVKAQHLTLGAYGGMISLGYRSGDARYENTWLDAPLLINRSVFKGQIYQPLAATPITTGSQITDDLMGMWVKLVGVTYQGGDSGLKTWGQTATADTPAGNGQQNFTFGDGVKIVVRTGGYATFAGHTVPFAVGQKADISGILTRYNDTFQLVLNTDQDAVAAQ